MWKRKKDNRTVLSSSKSNLRTKHLRVEGVNQLKAPRPFRYGRKGDQERLRGL